MKHFTDTLIRANIVRPVYTPLAPNTQTASPRALADSLMQLARQVSRLESGQ
jgi:transcriptional regulator, LacI family